MAKGDAVIDNPHPHEIANAINVASAGRTDIPPNSDPKNMAIINGEKPNMLKTHKATGKMDKTIQSGVVCNPKKMAKSSEGTKIPAARPINPEHPSAIAKVPL